MGINIFRMLFCASKYSEASALILYFKPHLIRLVYHEYNERLPNQTRTFIYIVLGMRHNGIRIYSIIVFIKCYCLVGVLRQQYQTEEFPHIRFARNID